MNLEILDITIIFSYIILTVVVGVMISRRASKNLDSYFLGSKKLPWYILGVSNASGMMDITSSMWLVYLCFVYGAKSIFITWLWPVFNQIFLMVFLSVWVRRSNVLTGGEWITTRFGKDKGAELSRISIVIFALISVIGFLSYAFKGIGKFADGFLPWELSPDTYAIIFMGITTVYVILGGMYSVAFTDLIQFFVLTVASIAVGIIAMTKISPEMLEKVVPDGWTHLFFGLKLNLDWSNVLPVVNKKIEQDGYSWFSIIVGMMLFKGFFVSMAGPAPNYDMQRILATRNPKESAYMSGLVSLVLPFPRYFLVVGITVIALVFYMPELESMGMGIDFETILPFIINNYVPAGLLGLILVGFIAAFMSTFDSTVNAGSAYLVNDIYKRYINPGAKDKTYVIASYIASLFVVIIGIGLGLVITSIDSITQWLFAALFGGYAASNVLKWYWWRLNGYGYFWGMLAGILTSLFIPVLFPHLKPLFAFPFILFFSFMGCFAGSFCTKQQDMEELKSFYKQVRPWGFWNPVYKEVIKDDPDFQKNRNFKRDMFNVLTGIIWQTSLIIMPFYIVIRKMPAVIASLVVVIITTIVLKINWMNKLEN